jgi:NAD(P)-dependent dehydrogenase (short-subunit alcohol dehydrogenase family)
LYQFPSNLNNRLRKSVIVTGASSGIGKYTVLKLAECGYQVFGLARRYDKLANILSYEGLSKDLFIPIEFDITNSETFDDILNNIISKTKENIIYGLVNNAGYVEPGAVEDITMDNLRKQFETNFFGLVEFTKKVLPLMMIQRDVGAGVEGRVVNVSSLAGLISLPLIGAYSAAKHALEAISDALRMELWDKNIKIITINPGSIETNIYDILKTNVDNIIANNKHSRFIGSYSKYFIKRNSAGLKPSVVANVICNAISSPNPKQKYVVGSTKEKLAVRLRPFIPDSLFYPLIAKQIRQ